MVLEYLHAMLNCHMTGTGNGLEMVTLESELARNRKVLDS